MKNKVIVIVSCCLAGITIIGLIIGLSFVLDYRKNSSAAEYSIVVADEVTIYLGETYALVPYLVRKDGTIEESRFEYIPSSSDISVTDDGVVSIQLIPDSDVFVEIFERNTATKANVKLNVISQIDNVLGITFSDDYGNTALISGKQYLEFGESYSIDVITEPKSINIKDYCNVKILDKFGVEKEVLNISYNKNAVSFTTVGLGDGTLVLEITNEDDEIVYSNSFDINISASDETFTELVMVSSEKELLSQNDISNIASISINDAVQSLSSLRHFSNLQTVTINCAAVVTYQDIPSGYCYKVPEELFYQFYENEAWAAVKGQLMPYRDGNSYIVYHSDKGEEIYFEKITTGHSLRIIDEIGYTNTGWINENGEPIVDEDLSDVGDNSIHIFATWHVNEFEVVYHVRGSGSTDLTTGIEQWNYDTSRILRSARDFSPVPMAWTGYKLVGWTTNPGGSKIVANNSSPQFGLLSESSKLSSEQGATVDLYDVWMAIEYRIVFDVPEDTIPIESIAFYYNNSSNSLPSATRDGYTFTHWNTVGLSENKSLYAGPCSENLATIDGAEISLQPNFTEIEYTIEFDFDGGTATQDPGLETKTLTYTQVYTLPYLEREGYTEYFWECEANGKTYDARESIEKEFVSACVVTFTAKWTAAKYTINYNCNGGSISNESNITVERGWDDGKTILAPARRGYTFNHWKDSETDIIYEAGDARNLIGSTEDKGKSFNFIAQWQANRYTVTLNNNGGSGGSGSATVTFDAPMPFATAPSRAGYTFTGYYDAPSGATQYYTSEMRSAMIWNKADNVTLYARWSAIQYAISKSNDGNQSDHIVLSFSSGVSNGMAYCGTIVQFKIKTDNHNAQLDSIKCGDANIPVTGNAEEYSFTMPAGAVIITVRCDTNHCFAEGTLIMLGDGTCKPIEEIKTGDLVMSWNFFNGEVEVSPVILYWDHGSAISNIINLYFSDDSTLSIVSSHGLFDYSLMEFVYITPTNYMEYIGHSFAKCDMSGERDIVILETAELISEEVRAYSLQTAYNSNAIAEGFISITPATDFLNFYTYFDIDDNLKYNKEKMEEDIATYGLYTYEEWADYVTREVFTVFYGQYFKILVGKGILSIDDIFMLLEGMKDGF